MIRAGVFGLVAAGVATPLWAAEGGTIRAGEHQGFTRVVLTVEPTTEWSLETLDGRATLRFPGKRLVFTTDGVYDKIPRTRIKAVTVAPDPSGTAVTVDLGCDCRVSTSFVGARYLALDVADRDALPAPVAEAPAAPAETPEARAARETAAVATAEQVLIRQIERAASQGIVRFSEPERPSTTAAPPLAEAPGVPTPPQAEATPPAEPESEPQGVLAAFAGSDQVQATTVFDRDSRRALEAAGKPGAVPGVCLADERLDVGAWSNGMPLVAQVPDLRRRLVSEFDATDPAALRDLARLYVRFGFGAEAEALLAAFPGTPVEDRALLADLARTVDGRPLAAAGPLSAAEACPGNHGLWQALGSAAPAWRDAASFAAAQSAFSALPADLRALLAPGFIERLIAAGHAAEARMIYETAMRPGEPADAALELAAARIGAAEGHPMEAARALNALLESDGHTSVNALAELTRIVIDARLPIPDRVVTDLRAAALQFRGAPVEAELRALLIEALAHRAELPAALEETRAAMRDLPAAASAMASLAVRLLGEADPAATGPAAYAATVLAAGALIAGAPAADPARIAIAERLLALGLPDPALAALAPAVAAGDEAARLVAARAELGRGDAEAARAALGTLAGPQAVELRARAFALSGAYGQALATLADGGMPAEAATYAWPSGDWSRARVAAEDDPERMAMASYMTVETGAAAAPPPAADPAALSPDLAFQEPLPPLERPSLDAARRLLSTGDKIGGFIQGVLTEDAAPPE